MCDIFTTYCLTNMYIIYGNETQRDIWKARTSLYPTVYCQNATASYLIWYWQIFKIINYCEWSHLFKNNRINKIILSDFLSIIKLEHIYSSFYVIFMENIYTVPPSRSKYICLPILRPLENRSLSYLSLRKFHGQ